MSHQPQTCEHNWSSWDYEPERVYQGVLIRRLERHCFLCGHVEVYGAAPRTPERHAAQ